MANVKMEKEKWEKMQKKSLHSSNRVGEAGGVGFVCWPMLASH